MSFRADDQRRYGQVPPVQYPIAGQRPDRYPVGRRLSFNTGDDAAYHGEQASDGLPASGPGAQRPGADELFLNSPTASNSAIGRSAFGSADGGYHPDTTPRTPPARSAYNPQTFAHASGAAFQRSPISAVPLPSHSSSRYPASGSSPGTSGFAPHTYNPAAYASTNSPQRQPTYSGYGNEQGYGAAVDSGASAIYGQAPGAIYSAPLPHQILPTSPSSFAAPGSSDQASAYDPSRYAAGFYPAQGVSADSQGPGSFPATHAPYPVSSHIPVGPNYDFDESASFYNPRFRSDSQTSRGASSHSAGLQRHPTHAPLPSRPMDDLIDEEVYWDSNGRPLGREPSVGGMTSESIMQELEAELGDDGRWPRRRPSPINGQLAREQAEQLRRNDTADGPYSLSANRASPGAGHRSVDYDDDDDDDDDPEATAGVLAMQQAELDDQRFSGKVFMYSDVPAPVPSNPLPPPPEEDDMASDGELVGAVDLGMLSGGYAGKLTYGPGIGSHLDSSLAIEGSRPLPTPGYYTSLNEGWNAEMDYGGTGGLQPPRAQRLSFDESRDESVSLHSRQSGADSPTKTDAQDSASLHYPGLSHRPLPALPPGPDSDSSSMLSAQDSLRSHHQRHQSFSADARYYHADPEKFYQANTQQTPQPERSISLSDHSHTPQVQAPTRSRTDAAEERKKMTRQHMTGLQHGPSFPESEVGSGSFDGIVLPTGRKKKFVPSKLTASDFRKCQEPWALSGIEAWVRSMGDAEVDLRQKTVEEAITNLFTSKVPTMNVADAEMLSGRVVQLMLASGTLIPDEEWVKFGENHISGVLWQMTGSGCYASKVHDFETAGHCYSRQCSRSSKRLFLGSLLLEHEEENDWRVFYKLKPEDYEGRSNKELQLQFNLHEVVTGERTYLYQLEIFHALYRDELRTRDPAVIHPDKIEKFLATVFRKLDTIFAINRDHLLSPLRYRRQEQAPWVVGFSDIFREWIRKAKADYLEFASGYPRAAYMIRKEAERNILFKKFIDDRQRHKLSSKQDWTHFLFQPIQRLQRYPLLLEAVEKLMVGESEERTNLIKAIQEIRAVVLECDARVAETTKRVQMMELDRMLVLRPGFQSVLNLDHLGRVLIREGELQRMGSKGMRWVDTHALLFDHYMILAKIVIYKDSKGEKKYDVSREPIPMPLLFLESMNDEPVTKQKVIAAPLGRTAAAPAASAHLHKSASNGSGRQGPEHAATGSTSSIGAQSSYESEGKILYPFKLKHLGYEVYTLYASSAQNRLDWCNSIIEAKTRHAKALFSQNAEPFRLRVLADASFHYDAGSIYARATGVPVKGTPLDRALQGIEEKLGSAQGIAPVCRAQVNCAAGFSAFGKSVIAIGTDYGVYVSDPSEPRGWRRTIQTARVMQIAILEEFSVCLVLADKSLISYPLDVVAPCSDFAPPINDNPRRAPQRLAKDVAYFATARMKDRMLVFYKRKEGLHTSFKVLEPILHKASEKKSRLFGGRRPATGITDTFRDFDEFYLPTDCYSLSVFHTYIAVSTAKGIEMLTLDKKQPMSIPDLKAQTIANIALRIRDQRPLGMFRLNDNEFILTYEDCAVYVDKHGDVSRTLIMEYTGKQKKDRGATMYGQYLLLFNEDYVEVRNAENGRLRQIIAGRDVRVIDFGIRGPTGGNAAESQQSLLGQNGQMADAGEVSKGTVKIAMCHPELPGKQIVLEMLLNDGHAE